MDLSPGTRVKFNNGCPWPKRIGCEGVVVDPASFKGRYPADKRDKDRVIVLLDADPYKGSAMTEPMWTCVTRRDSLDVIG